MAKLIFAAVCALSALVWLWRAFSADAYVRAKVAPYLALIGAIQVLACLASAAAFAGRIPRTLMQVSEDLNWFLSGVLGVGIGLLILGLLTLRRNSGS